MAANRKRNRPPEILLRHRDVVLEAVRRRAERPEDTLRAVSAHNEALLRLEKAGR